MSNIKMLTIITNNTKRIIIKLIKSLVNITVSIHHLKIYSKIFIFFSPHHSFSHHFIQCPASFNDLFPRRWSLINSHLVDESFPHTHREKIRGITIEKKNEKRSKAGYRVRRRVAHTRGTCYSRKTRGRRRRRREERRKIRERIELAHVVERKKRKKYAHVLAGETSVKRDRRVESREHAILLGTWRRRWAGSCPHDDTVWSIRITRRVSERPGHESCLINHVFPRWSTDNRCGWWWLSIDTESVD